MFVRCLRSPNNNAAATAELQQQQNQQDSTFQQTNAASFPSAVVALTQRPAQQFFEKQDVRVEQTKTTNDEHIESSTNGKVADELPLLDNAKHQRKRRRSDPPNNSSRGFCTGPATTGEYSGKHLLMPSLSYGVLPFNPNQHQHYGVNASLPAQTTSNQIMMIPHYATASSTSTDSFVFNEDNVPHHMIPNNRLNINDPIYQYRLQHRVGMDTSAGLLTNAPAIFVGGGSGDRINHHQEMYSYQQHETSANLNTSGNGSTVSKPNNNCYLPSYCHIMGGVGNQKSIDAAVNSTDNASSLDHDDDLCLPRSVINKLVKDAAGRTRVSAESRDLFVNCCHEFVRVLCSIANTSCELHRKKLIGPDHILTALSEMGLDSFRPLCLDVMNTAQEEAAQKRRRISSRFDCYGLTADELKREQQELFAKARQEHLLLTNEEISNIQQNPINQLIMNDCDSPSADDHCAEDDYD
ncbi:hypothetical protein GJ496_002936 [Pomphorhynchus laevis]|nr:hypothetical protein GJ496_002936 [Pomphorhynchus laevis]